MTSRLQYSNFFERWSAAAPTEPAQRLPIEESRRSRCHCIGDLAQDVRIGLARTRGNMEGMICTLDRRDAGARAQTLDRLQDQFGFREGIAGTLHKQHRDRDLR